MTGSGSTAELRAAAFVPEGCKRPLSLVSSVRRNTLWCVQTSPKGGPVLRERAVSCSTDSEPSGAAPAPLLRCQPKEPAAGSPPAGRGGALLLETHFSNVQARTASSDLCVGWAGK